MDRWIREMMKNDRQRGRNDQEQLINMRKRYYGENKGLVIVIRTNSYNMYK